MTLEEYRKDAEAGGKVLLVVVHNDGGYKVVYTIIKYEKGDTSDVYRLHRYFTVGGEWVHSVDVRSENIKPCFDYLNTDFSTLLPKD